METGRGPREKRGKMLRARGVEIVKRRIPTMNTYPRNTISTLAAVLSCMLAIGAAGAAIYRWLHPPGDPLAPVMLLLLVPAFLRAAYLAYFRWSPLAVRHVIGALFFILTVWLLFTVRNLAWWTILIACYVLYRIASFQLSRYAFANRLPKVVQEAETPHPGQD
jgi:hypothetical protein